VASLIAAYLVGYALAYFVFGEPGLDATQALYLNAFVIVGLFGIALKLVVSGNPNDVSLSNLPVAVQSKILHRVRLVFGVAVYGVLAVAPIVQIWTNFLIGRSVRAIFVVIAVLLALHAIRAIKRSIDRAGTQEVIDDQAPRRAAVWPVVWPWFAVLYVLTCFVIAITQQSTMIASITKGTLYTAAAYAVFLMAGRVIGSVMTITLPVLPTIERLLPGLTNRLSSLAPPLTFIAGVLLTLLGFGLLLSGWTSFNVFEWMSAQSGWSEGIINATLLLLVFIMIWAVVSSWIDNRLTLDLPGRNVSARTRTLLSLFRNAFTVAIVIIGIMTILSEIGINIAPLLAGAGVLGLAIGFGAQKLVQDIITGVFIQLENAINEGDVVSVAGITGSVEKLTIRSVSLRSLDGQFHIIPFNSVDTVSNYMRRFGFHVAEIGVAYGEQIPEVKEAMLEAFRRLEATEHKTSILEPFEMHGVTSLGDSAVVVRGRIKTRPGDQWAVGRAYTELAKQVLDERGIEIPFPHRELKLPKELLDHFSATPAQS
ncbi:MAG: mechanosensitive ion channel domain-containing protein, partial [Pseudomonadota bacterium]